MKKIISFSLWGTNKGYLCGAIKNAQLAKTLFPGWTCRFYVASNLSTRVVEDLRQLCCEVVYKPVPIGFIGLFWRFEPAYDDLDIERFIVRDADSRLTKRDALCNQEWIDSKEPCHIIRDCESHGIWMLGATWGLVPSFIPDFQDLVVDFWENVYGTSQDERGTYNETRGKFFGADQEFLSQKIWPLVKDHHIAHDEHFKFTGRERPFPYKREYLSDMNKAREPYVGMTCQLEPEFDNYII